MRNENPVFTITVGASISEIVSGHREVPLIIETYLWSAFHRKS